MRAIPLLALQIGLLFFYAAGTAFGLGEPDKTDLETTLAPGDLQNVEPIEGADPQVPYRITAEAIDEGKGYGVGWLVIENIPAQDEHWAFDQVVNLNSEHCRIWFPARSDVNVEATQSPQSVKVYFVFDEGFPKTVDLYVNGKRLQKEIPVAQGLGSFAHAATVWWKTFSEQSYALATDELRESNRDLLASLGQLLGHTPERRPIQADKKSSTQLEKEFERTLGMLLGFESVRLAMMTDDSKDEVDNSPAHQQLPRSLNVVGLQLPPMTSLPNASIPTIAEVTPQDCYFVRCKSLKNYLWLRGLLVDWGGSINDLVSSSAIQPDVRARIEKQLALKAESLEAAGIDSMLEDMAVIGSDVLFEQGAGVGVLFQAKPGFNLKLAKVIESERNAGAARAQQLQIDGLPVSLLSTPDNRVRSYYVRMDNFILLTNSSHILRSVVHAKLSHKSLANLSEFKYAVATNPNAEKSRILFYLSDPFFRRLASAPFRIELSRRRAAEADCRRLELASIMAEATGHPFADKQSLIQAAVLPTGFGKRSDGSSVEFQGGEAYDTLRGKPGTFVPVVDINVVNCNMSEQTAYHAFASRYRQEWRVMDPVLASLDAVPLGAELERLNLSVHITPYARQEYQFLTQYLGAPSRTYLTAGADELMGVSASLQQHGQTYAAHLGVVDKDLHFTIERGRVMVDGKANKDIFAHDSSFAVVTPSDTNGLMTLNGLMKSLQERKPIQIPRSRPAAQQVRSRPQPSNPFSIFRSVIFPEELLVRASAVAVEGVIRASAMANVSEDDHWAIYASDADLHSKLRENLVVRESQLPAEIHAIVKDIQSSTIAPYINAVTYCDARRDSARVAAWLNLWTNGLSTDPSGFRRAVEQGANGQLVCPLGGQWNLKYEGSDPFAAYSSSKWQEPHLSSADRVPADYRFDFLDWFRGLELRFSLTNTSLESDIYVNYKPSSDRNQHRLQSDDQNTPATALRTDSRLAAAPPSVALPPDARPFAPSSTVASPAKAAALNSAQDPPALNNAEEKNSPREPDRKPIEIGIRINAASMVVSFIKPDLPASRSDLQVGDRIVELDGSAVDNLESLRSGIVAAGNNSGVVNLTVHREGRQRQIEIHLNSSAEVDL